MPAKHTDICVIREPAACESFLNGGFVVKPLERLEQAVRILPERRITLSTANACICQHRAVVGIQGTGDELNGLMCGRK